MQPIYLDNFLIYQRKMVFINLTAPKRITEIIQNRIHTYIHTHMQFQCLVWKALKMLRLKMIYFSCIEMPFTGNVNPYYVLKYNRTH